MQDILYHYTNVTGLKEILRTKTFHATHYRFLNDPDELRHARGSVKELFSKAYLQLHKEGKIEGNLKTSSVLSELLNENKLPETQEEFIIRYSQIIALKFLRVYENDATPYVISFSQHKDDFTKKNGILNQWRNYGGDGGYAIGFSRDVIAGQLEAEHNAFRYLTSQLLEIEYGTPEWSDADISKAKNVALEILRNEINREDESDFSKLADQVFQSCLTFKSPAFIDEHEVRALFVTFDGPAKDKATADQSEKVVCFKTREGSLVPHICVFNETDNLPIENILVGPHPNQKRRLEAVKMYCNSFGYENLPVDDSKIAYTSFF